MNLPCQIELEAPQGGSLCNRIVVARHLEACEEASYRNQILPAERVRLYLNVHFLPITVTVSRYSSVVARIKPLQAVGLVIDVLSKQAVERPDYHGPSVVAPRSNPAVSARATTLLIRFGLVVF